MRLDKISSSYCIQTRKEFKFAKKWAFFAKWDILEASRWGMRTVYLETGRGHSTTLYGELGPEEFDFIPCFISK